MQAENETADHLLKRDRFPYGAKTRLPDDVKIFAVRTKSSDPLICSICTSTKSAAARNECILLYKYNFAHV